MDGWTVDIDVAGEDDPAEFEARLEALEGVLEPYGGAVAAGAGHDRYGARFSLDTESQDPAEVLEHALLIFRDAAFAVELPRWPVVRCEILTYDEDDRRSAEEDEADEA